MDLDHTSRACKGHPRHITTPTKPPPYLLGAPLLILPGPHLLLGPSHLNIMPNQPPIHFNPMLSHNLSGMHLLRGGGPNTTLLQLFCLHHLPNHNSYTPAPPRQPQMPAQPNPNPNNRQAQQVYSGETSYPTYAVEIQEINLRSGRVLPDNQPPLH